MILFGHLLIFTLAAGIMASNPWRQYRGWANSFDLDES